MQQNELLDSFKKSVQFLSKDKQLYIFGAGMYGEIFGKFFNKHRITWCGFIDNDKKKRGRILCNKEICMIQDLKETYNTSVLIPLSPITHKRAVESIILQLQDFGIIEEYIEYVGSRFELVEEVIRDIYSSEIYTKRNSKLKNIYSGRRCFIIGNGPSLTVKDLACLENEITMGCNSLINIANRIKWAPTCYFCTDYNCAKVFLGNSATLTDISLRCQHVFTSMYSGLSEVYGDRYPNLFYLHLKRKNKGDLFSEDICRCIYNWGTTIFAMMQVAVYMGIKEIYLIGTDFSFNKTIHSDGTIIKNPSVNDHWSMIDSSNGIYAVDEILEEYHVAKKYANEHGIKIYNATRGGKLEVFERVDFDTLFDES